MTARVRRQGYRAMGMDVLVLKTVGRRSGAQQVTPVAWFSDGDGGWLVVASAGGKPHHPAWYHNLLAHPDEAGVELPGGEVPVRATELRGPERAEHWERIAVAQPRYAKYQRRTQRQIPVVRLTPRDVVRPTPHDVVPLTPRNAG